HAGAGGLSQAGDQRADRLSLEAPVGGDGCRRTAARAAAGGRESPSEAARGGSDLGSTHAPGGHPEKALKPAPPEPMVGFGPVGFGVSERRACRVMGCHRRTSRYRSRANDQTALRMRLRELASVRVRYGYRRLHTLLRREGWCVHHTRVYRLYCLEGLSVRAKVRRQRVSALRLLVPAAQAPNEHWRMDCMSDSLANGQRIRLLTIVDNMSRESPAIEVD